MNRIQFLVLTTLSGLVALLLVLNIFLVRWTNFEQNRLAAAQQVVTQGQAFEGNLKQLAIRILQDSQKTQDPGLKEILDRQQIKFTPNADGSAAGDNSSVTPAPAAH